MNYIIVLVLLIFSALFSGLTLGLMSLSAPELKRKMTLGNKDAAKVYAVRKNGNLLLTTLLVGNVAVNAALSIFLNSLASGVAAGLIATGLIVVFGEIMPQAAFSRYALKLGARFASMVRIFIYLFYVISWPISWVLDKALGEELPNVYSKQELMKIVEEHEGTTASDLDADEERIIKGALTFSDKTVRDVMTPRSVVDMLEAGRTIDDKLIKDVIAFGHSRIPIYKETRDNVIGILYTKRLLEKKTHGRRIEKVFSDEVRSVSSEEKLDTIFNEFLRSRKHLFIVGDGFGSVVGVVSLEDVLEEILNSEIMDEGDKYKDLRKLARQKRHV